VNPPRDLVHDDAPTKTPSHPTMAGAFDRLVDSNLELVASVKELVGEVRLLIKAMTEGKAT
jgi:hypothetical protein